MQTVAMSDRAFKTSTKTSYRLAMHAIYIYYRVNRKKYMQITRCYYHEITVLRPNNDCQA